MSLITDFGQELTLTSFSLPSEQLIPMFGLLALEHIAHPESTFEKFIFLVENITRLNSHTAIISAIALAVLVSLRSFKQLFKRWWFIYRLPEVLIVVIVSTGSFHLAKRRHNLKYCSFELSLSLGSTWCGYFG